MITNIKEGNIQNKQKCKDINEIINKISDISFYRNALIHNAGEEPTNFYDNILCFKPISEFPENFLKNKLLEYLEVYEEYN